MEKTGSFVELMRWSWMAIADDVKGAADGNFGFLAIPRAVSWAGKCNSSGVFNGYI